MRVLARIAYGLSFACAVSACSRGDGNLVLRAVGDEPGFARHVSQSSIEAGDVSLPELIAAGHELFTVRFNSLDGLGRPEATGTGASRPRREAPQNFNRLSSPDTESCAGCHNKPGAGGGGDNVANVFVLAQTLPFVNFDGQAGDDFMTFTLSTVANERATIGMFGSGYIELLAREITEGLQEIRENAIAQAANGGAPVTLPLVAKGVDFGSITAQPDGSVDTTAVEGVDADLVIKPFHQKGVVTSLREFTNNAMNHHHGMQSSERFGAGVDHDQDGVKDEITVGDMTAITLFQATLPAPGRVLPDDAEALAAVARGEAQFAAIGCAECHVPELVVDDPMFSEPNPFNPEGNLRLEDVPAPVVADLTSAGPGPFLPRESDGSVVVRAYTDFKRHDMGPDLAEARVQAGVPTTEFITKKLWGFANELPFMHHGRATTISEAILMHGGEAEAARDAFAALAQADRNDVVDFLETLQVLSPGAEANEILAPYTGMPGDQPALTTHVDQVDIDNGVFSPTALSQLGERVFVTDLNSLDGVCRPETTGTGDVRARRDAKQSFNRISGPDSVSCAACHNMPRPGGGGENMANVFVLAQALPFVNFDGGAGDDNRIHTLETVGNERATIGMFGSGFVELLARELSVELQEIRDSAVARAVATGEPVTFTLVAKGVDFGSITANPDMSVDTGAVVGVDADLVVRPFHQKGVVVSLREFTNNAANHHHGMQSSERFGHGADPDNDGVIDELTVGDMTALTIFQAMLPAPAQVLPDDAAGRASVAAGEVSFTEIGCAECHVPSLVLDDPVFTEPNPFNPPGNLRVSEVPHPFAVDLTVHGVGPRLARRSDGTVVVPAYTDLKRHDMGPELAEPLVQAGVPTSEFITKKLWGFANEPPFMHHGRAETIDEAIMMHGGEAEAARDAYASLTASDRHSVVDFLKTLQVVDANDPARGAK